MATKEKGSETTKAVKPETEPEQTENKKPGPGRPPGSKVADQASARLNDAKQKRGRKSKADKEAEIAQQEREREMAQALEMLYGPENWEGIVCAPADAMLMITGRELWNLSEKERKTLAVNGSMTARYFMQTDPKWVAMILFGFSLVNVYGTRAITNYMEYKKDMQERAEIIARQKNAGASKPNA